MHSSRDFRSSWLWRHAFVNPLPNTPLTEQEFFRDCFLKMRDKAQTLVSQISSQIPGLTVHDITHLDALWDTASLVSEGAITFSPAEAFVFGASVLIHDSAMSLSAYPNGLADLKATVEWQDIEASLMTDTEQHENCAAMPLSEIEKRVIPEVLRQLHAKQAALLAKQGWRSNQGDTLYLIDDEEIRFFYGETIGQIAHSHWWPISLVEQTLSEDLGALPNRTKSRIDRVKLACLLRISDALQLDQRRAPRFLRALSKPQGTSENHWTFQERLAAPHIERESVVFTSAAPFSLEDADAWWLAYDTMLAVDRELQDVDQLLQNRGRGLFFRAKRVKGVGSPDALARTIATHGWRPIDTRLRISDIPKIVETLGGSKLYGDDPSVVLRELIQNCADAIQARRRYQNRRADWGAVTIALVQKKDRYWLTVEDNGIGMSEKVMTGPLIDFGTSFWRSSLATQEFPGLVAKGMNAIGRYGIGFFSVFMLGSAVRVYSRRFDYSIDSARLLEFRSGTGARPIMSPARPEDAPIDGGTRVEVMLKTDPRLAGGILYMGYNSVITLKQLIASIAPNIDVSLDVIENDIVTSAVHVGDWLRLKGDDLFYRLNPSIKQEPETKSRKPNPAAEMRQITRADATPIGRAFIRPTEMYHSADGGWVTIGGLRAARMKNIHGILIGEALTASRNLALPVISKKQLSEWATNEADIIGKSGMDDRNKNRVAEVVLECGGNVGELPIVCRGPDDWLTASGFTQAIITKDNLAIYFDGEFSYDEDDDEMHPREFRQHFKINSEILTVTKHDGSVLDVGRQSWPRSITGLPNNRETNLSRFVRELITSVWGSFDEMADQVEVGTVNEYSIQRSLAVFTRSEMSPN